MTQETALLRRGQRNATCHFICSDLLERGHVGHVVVSPLPLLLLQLDGDAAHGGALQPLHQVGDEPGDLVAKRLGGDQGNLDRETGETVVRCVNLFIPFAHRS